MRLTDDQLRDVLTRAEEIQSSAMTGAAADAEREAVIQAGEAVGLQRSAVERALQERFSAPPAPPSPGELVFAQSADDKYYVAEVVSTAPESLRVRFLWGSEHTVPLDEARPSRFLPGEKVMCEWPWWGPFKATVVRYDAAKQRVKLSDGWGSTKTFPIAEVWVNALGDNDPRLVNQGRLKAAMLAVGAAVGGILGSALTWLLLR
jgi:hypothetical protein